MKKLLLTAAILAVSSSAANAGWHCNKPARSIGYAATYPGHVVEGSKVVVFNERHYDWNYWGQYSAHPAHEGHKHGKRHGKHHHAK